jgi:hypothetical protein
LAQSPLKDVLFLANFNVTTQTVPSGFATQVRYNLMDNSEIVISSTSQPISLQPGEFKIYGNKQFL